MGWAYSAGIGKHKTSCRYYKQRQESATKGCPPVIILLHDSLPPQTSDRTLGFCSYDLSKESSYNPKCSDPKHPLVGL